MINKVRKLILFLKIIKANIKTLEIKSNKKLFSQNTSNIYSIQKVS